MTYIPITPAHVVAVDAWRHPRTPPTGPAAVAVAAWVLTHAHGDHMAGLGERWDGGGAGGGRILCSPPTAAALRARFGDALAARCDPFGPGARAVVRDACGVELAVLDAVDAHHCPVRARRARAGGRAGALEPPRPRPDSRPLFSLQGSIMVLVRSRHSGTVLHTGDARVERALLPRFLASLARAAGPKEPELASPAPSLASPARGAAAGGTPGRAAAAARVRARARAAPPPPPPLPAIDALLLDNTYCHPTINHPPRAAVAAAAVAAARARRVGAVGVVADGVGKEELIAALAAALGAPARVGAVRLAIARAAGFPGRLFVGFGDGRGDGAAGAGGAPSAPPALAAVPRRAIAPFLEAAADRDAPSLLLVPSGLGSLQPSWCAAAARAAAAASAARPAGPGRAPHVELVELPYSLHSGFAELAALVSALRPRAVRGLTPPREGGLDIDPASHLPAALAALSGGKGGGWAPAVLPAAGGGWPFPLVEEGGDSEASEGGAEGGEEGAGGGSVEGGGESGATAAADGDAADDDGQLSQ